MAEKDQDAPEDMKGLVIAGWIMLAALFGVGAYYAAGHGSDDRGASGYGQGLLLAEVQMETLKGRLIDYKKTHGRYPTMDEGLASLDNFSWRGRVSWPYMSNNYGESYFAFCESTRAWESLKINSGLVLSDGEFSDSFFDGYKDRPAVMVPMELAIVAGNNNRDEPFLIYEGQLLSPWMTPYVYENRAGLAAEKFKGSPVDEGCDMQYTVKVDEGVYICAPGGKVFLAKIAAARWRYNQPRLIGAGMIAVGLVIVLAVAIRRRATVKAIMFAMILPLIGGVLVGKGATRSCYVGSMASFYDSSRETAAIQRELLDKYHSAGVINDQTYRKSMEILDRDFKAAETQPTSGPASGATSEPAKK